LAGADRQRLHRQAHLWCILREGTELSL